MNIAAENYGYTLNVVAFDLGMCFLVGCVLRVIGYVLMVRLNRTKQI